jgi:hypothetical protein
MALPRRLPTIAACLALPQRLLALARCFVLDLEPRYFSKVAVALETER